MNDPTKLLILPFLQRWEKDTSKLSLRILLIPRDPFILPFVENNPTSLAFFPNVQFTFNLRLLPSLQQLPTPQSGEIIQSISLPPDPQYFAVFKKLQENYGGFIEKNSTRIARPAGVAPLIVRKHLPTTYRDATGYTPTGSEFFTTDDTYSCAMKKLKPKPWKKFEARPFRLSWGELVASILRIPDFGLKAGLIRVFDVSIPAAKVESGAYLWLEIDAQTSATIGISPASPAKTYATRLPPMTESRDLFTPVLFPVQGTAPSVEYDSIAREAEDYVDGWAKAVHCVQPTNALVTSEQKNKSRPVKELGIRLGWDDEQVTIWANRQMNPDPAKREYDEFPLGVHGYRVDVKDVTTGNWYSLSRAQGTFGIEGAVIGDIKSELGVDVHPFRTLLDAKDDPNYWLPMYFTNWVQTSLVGMDEDSMAILGRQIPPSGVHRGFVDPALQLRYGKSYQFRVRLMDHTGGGPGKDSTPSNLGASPNADVTFRRWIKPLTPILVGPMPSLREDHGAENVPEVAQLEFKRPMMTYPACVFAGYPNAVTELKKQAVDISKRIATLPRDSDEFVLEPTLPDVDVDRVEIAVLIQTVPQDPLAIDGPYLVLYTTTRQFPKNDFLGSVKVSIQYQDCSDIWHPPRPWKSTSTEGPILLPTARTIRLRVKALCRDEPNVDDPYFGQDDVRHGPELVIPLRKNSALETDLFAQNPPSYTMNGFFMQHDLDMTAKLAAALGLRNSKDTTLRARAGRRVVFACASSLLHVIGPDRGSLSFATQSDLALRWIVVIRLTLKRDWSWDGMPLDGIRVSSGDAGVLFFAPGHSVTEDALATTPDRSSSDIVIVDVIDPKPPEGQKPVEIHLQYKIEARFLTSVAPTSDAPLELSIRLPVATPPAQVPELASVGVAMSPYEHDEAYSTTTPRKKMLWVEFAAPLKDEQDRYFCRVLKYAPDPLLVPPQYDVEDSDEPQLPLDPESIRQIIPEQSADFAGQDVMQQLMPTTSPLHWILPLPVGMTENSLELLGFWTYEFRVGHFTDETHPRWSTAQGRFGAPLRVAGVQHPPPILTCSLSRDADFINVSAPLANAVYKGKVLRPGMPKTQIWFLLYAQVAQVDGGSKRNLLISRRAGSTGKGGNLPSVARFRRESGNDEYGVNELLKTYGLERGTPLSAMAVELFGQPDRVWDPLGGDLGRQRILRTSCLVAIPSMCA